MFWLTRRLQLTAKPLRGLSEANQDALYHIVESLQIE